MKVTVESVRPAPQGFGPEVVALATVVWEPSKFDGPVTVTRWQAGKDDKPGRAWPVAQMVAPTAVRLMDLQIRRGQNGNHYVGTGCIELPADVLREIAAQAGRKIAQEEEAERRGDELPV